MERKLRKVSGVEGELKATSKSGPQPPVQTPYFANGQCSRRSSPLSSLTHLTWESGTQQDAEPFCTIYISYLGGKLYLLLLWTPYIKCLLSIWIIHNVQEVHISVLKYPEIQ